MQTEVEGIVLKETLYSETSKVIQVLTKEFGLKRFSFLKKPAFQWCWFILLFVLILATGVLDGGQFIYFQF